jgi:peptidoglycan/LPS O-acetylase OafA/YrhL
VQQKAPHSRLAFIDGLRALAILTVYATHATEQFGPISTHGAFVSRAAFDLNLGRLGVVTFFAISGFLIPSSLHGGPREGSFRFVVSRLFRLYPAFWLSVVPSVVGLYWMSGKPFAYDDMWLNFTMLPRFFDAPYANDGYWTLEVETIFYSLCLFLFLGGAIASQFVLSSIMFVLFCVFFTSQGALFGGALNPPLSGDTFFLCLNLACMFWGAMCRQWWEGQRIERLPGLMFWTFTAYWFVYAPLDGIWRWYGQHDHRVDTRLILGYGLGLGIFFAILVTRASLGRVMSWIGRISYSLYLLHAVAMVIWSWAIFNYPVIRHLPLEVNMLAALAIGLALADLSHRLVERPFIRFGRMLSDAVVRRARTDFRPNAGSAAPAGMVTGSASERAGRT